MDQEKKLRMYRSEIDTVIATDPIDAKLVIHNEQSIDLEEISDDFEEIDPNEEIEIEYPDGIITMMAEFTFLPPTGRVIVKARAADWIASHGRGVLGSSEW